VALNGRLISWLKGLRHRVLKFAAGKLEATDHFSRDLIERPLHFAYWLKWTERLLQERIALPKIKSKEFGTFGVAAHKNHS